ncbi:MAG TPA: PAS domain S-box protein [Candidatus Polarisedimenticolia bacterium]|nr:PAS domain S-box protein [Candidatus Polarisedimenticolia bacterium]
MAEPLPEPTFLLKEDGVILAANPAVEARLGLVRDDLRGRTLAHYLEDAPDKIGLFLEACARSTTLTLGGLNLRRPGKEPCPLHAEGALVRPRGRRGDALLLVRLVPKNSSDGQVGALHERLESLGREIDLRERAERDLRAQAELTRTTLASIGDAVIATDKDGRITSLNPVAESLTGWTAREAQGRPLDEVFRVVNETTRQAVVNPADRALREGVIVGLANHTVLLAKDGRETPVDDSAAPIRTRSGEMIGCVLVFRDITQRRRAENALLAKEAELRTIFDRSPFFLTRCSRDLRYRYVSRAYAEMLGMKAEEINGRPIAEVMGEERFRQIEPHIRHVLQGEPVQFETQLAVAAGVRDLWVQYMPDRNADGDILGWVASIVDITERKQAEVANARLAAIIESSDDAIISKDLSGVIQTWNSGAERVFGYTAAEATGRSVTMLIPEDRQNEEPGILARIQRGERVDHYETIRQHKDGSLLDISLSVSPVMDASGRVVGASKIARDITPRKRAQLEAQRRSEQVRRLAEAATRLNTVHDVRSILGLLAEEARALLGARRSSASITAHGDRTRSFVVQAEAESHGGWRDDGDERDLSDLYALVCPPNRPMRADQRQLLTNPAFQRTGQIAADVPAVRNWIAAPLTGLPESNVGLLQLSDKVEGDFDEDDESMLVQLTQMACVAIDNAWLLDHLREANRRKDEFLATLAHELRNPLAPLRNGLQVMKLSGNDTKAVATSRVMMERQLEAMVRLIDDLMDVNRISRGKIELRRQPVDVAQVVRAAVETSGPLIEAARHRLDVELPKSPLVVDADETRLAQVLSNLLNNAAKYTEPGGHIRLAAARERGKAVISVKDTGVGIPRTMLPRIFDLFTQVDRSLEKSQGGVGIGLSLVKGLVELHGGQVEARSDGPGKGSEFVVRLPLLEEAAAPPPRVDKAMSGQLGGYRVLVADDNVDSATSLAMLLRLMGNEVHTAHDGLQAVAVARDLQPDLALLDIGMPKLNGYETCQRIREQSGGRKVLLVALTGWGQDEDIRRSHLAGFDRHLVKPVEPAALEKLLGSMATKSAP